MSSEGVCLSYESAHSIYALCMHTRTVLAVDPDLLSALAPANNQLELLQ